jgi:hypothetical protein
MKREGLNLNNNQKRRNPADSTVGLTGVSIVNGKVYRRKKSANLGMLKRDR